MTDDVAVSGLTKRYGSVTAVADVSLSFPAGAVHVLAGPNGSGKTTLLRAVAGLTSPSAGTVTRPDSGLGYAFQRPNRYPDLTVAGNLDVFARLVDADPDWRATVVDRLRLGPVRHRRAGDLSDGFAKKLDLALAFLKRPRVLLLDEPLANVDEATERRLLDLLAAYRGPERTIVLTAHDLAAVEDLADRLVVLLDGTVVLDDRTEELTGSPRAAYDRVLDERR